MTLAPVSRWWSWSTIGSRARTARGYGLVADLKRIDPALLARSGSKGRLDE
jgi:hypothetical protein